MKYGILGATGPTGLELLKKLKGQTVSVYVRNPSKLPEDHGVEVVQGDLSDHKALQNWAAKQDVVFCALGHGLSLAQFFNNLGLGDYPKRGLMFDAIKVVAASGTKRIVHCSAYGAAETKDDLPFVFGKILKPLLIAESYADHERVEEFLKQSQIEWVVARPGMLTNGPATGIYRTEQRFVGPKAVSISRADVAHFMVRAAQGGEFLRKCVGLGY
jgi:putative NADH-flavin reductase